MSESNEAYIEVCIDCGNTALQKDEELWLKQEICKLIELRRMKVVNIRISKG